MDFIFEIGFKQMTWQILQIPSAMFHMFYLVCVSLLPDYIAHSQFVDSWNNPVTFFTHKPLRTPERVIVLQAPD